MRRASILVVLAMILSHGTSASGQPGAQPAVLPVQPAAQPATSPCETRARFYSEASVAGGGMYLRTGVPASTAGGGSGSGWLLLRLAAGLFVGACNGNARSVDLRIGLVWDFGSEQSLPIGGELQVDWPVAGWRLGPRAQVAKGVDNAQWGPSYGPGSVYEGPPTLFELGLRARREVFFLSVDGVYMRDNGYDYNTGGTSDVTGFGILAGVGLVGLPN